VQSSVAYTIGDVDVENLTLTGTSGISATGNAGDNVLTGNSGNNTLTGNAGNDTLNGGSGSDTMVGGQGNDTYVVAQTGDVVTEAANEGTDTVQSSITYTLGNNVENLTLTGTTAINGTGNSLDNVLTGNGGNNTLTGNAGNDTLNGGSGSDTMVGGTGDDVYYVDASGDVTTESAGQGVDTVNSSITRTLASNIELLFLTGASAINGTGNTLANLLRGNTGINTLAGAGGTDILEGGAGADILSNSSGNSLLNGGADNDTLTGTANNDLLIGGLGNDSITTGQGADIIVFNQGEGQDTVAASTTQDNVLALGGGIRYADLLFQKSANNLILKAGGTDQITFTNYYASSSNRSVDKLQIVIEDTSDYDGGGSDPLRNKKIATFDFDGLVSAFDAALVADPGLTTWALTNALVAQHLSGSDTVAIGGDLSYRYGRFDTLSDISFTPALALLAAAGFGTSTQALQSLGSLQDSSARLG
jgi:Ca2+-binding RTX toxin-like protein